MVKKKHLKWVIVIGLLAILIIGVFNPFEIIYTLDQSNEASQTGSFLMNSATQDTYPVIAQGFEMSNPIAGNINWVSFTALRSSIVTGTLKVQIWKDDLFEPRGPDLLVKSYSIPPVIITSSIAWVSIPINCTYANMGCSFLVLDFTDCIFTSSSYIRVYYSGNSYQADDDTFGLWSGTWQRSVNNVWTVDMSKDLRFRAYKGLIRCWQCSGTNPVSHDFGWATVCGQGDAVNYPYSTEPTCGGGGNNPPICNSINGPTEGIIGTEYEFTVSGSDPDGDSIEYKVDWDDGTVSPYQSSNTFTHTFWSEEYYDVTARVQDEHGSESTWSIPLTVFIGETGTNSPPVCTSVTGPTTGSTGVSYQFMADAVDPDGDPLQYYFDWGDGTNSGWIDTSVASKSWTVADVYSVMAKARDDSGLESAYCNPLSIVITGGGETLYSVTFTIKNRGSDVPLQGALVTFNSETKTSDGNGNVVFSGVLGGTLTASVTKDDYKPLSGSIVVDENKLIYGLLALTTDSYDSIFSDESVPPEPDWFSQYLILIVLVIIGIIATIVAVLKAPVALKVGIPVILWIIIAIICLLIYGGML